MEFIPKYLAKSFGFFESISKIKFFLYFLFFFFTTGIVSSLLGEQIVNITTPIVMSIVIIFFAGFVSAQHFSRKTWIPSSPLIVQFTSQAWFNSVLSLLSVIRHWGTLVFIHLLMVMVLFIIIASIVQAFGS